MDEQVRRVKKQLRLKTTKIALDAAKMEKEYDTAIANAKRSGRNEQKAKRYIAQALSKQKLATKLRATEVQLGVVQSQVESWALQRDSEQAFVLATEAIKGIQAQGAAMDMDRVFADFKEVQMDLETHQRIFDDKMGTLQADDEVDRVYEEMMAELRDESVATDFSRLDAAQVAAPPVQYRVPHEELL